MCLAFCLFGVVTDPKILLIVLNKCLVSMQTLHDKCQTRITCHMFISSCNCQVPPSLRNVSFVWFVSIGKVLGSQRKWTDSSKGSAISYRANFRLLLAWCKWSDVSKITSKGEIICHHSDANNSNKVISCYGNRKVIKGHDQ